MTNLPQIVADVKFLRPEEGGRKQPPGPPFTPRYRPHLVVQSPNIRREVVQGNDVKEDYLGVAFLNGPSDYEAGQVGRFTLALMYHPNVNYDALQPQATFTIREGGSTVGFGTILSRQDPIEETQRSACAAEKG